jgi:hypothetical protein
MNTSDLAMLKQLEEADPIRQIAALRGIRERVSAGISSRLYFDAAQHHVGSVNNDVRWQSLIVIGEYIPFLIWNDEIWHLILRYYGRDDDMQDALATVLLEHLLEFGFPEFFPRIESMMRLGDSKMLDLLERCWPMGEAVHNWGQVTGLLRECRLAIAENGAT